MDSLPHSNPIGPVINGTVSHGDCESCDNKDCKITKCGSIWECDECVAKDVAAAMAYQTPELQEERLQKHKEQELLDRIKKENAQIRIQADIFNAKLAAITELKKEIDAEPSIEKKNFALGRVLAERHAHLSELLFGLDAQKTEYENEQRAIQTYWVNLQKQLTQEEREKIKITDAGYKPVVIPQKIKKEAPKKNWDKTGVIAASQRSGIQEHLIQMTCQARNITPEAAVEILKGLKVPTAK
jgi:ribosomal protein L37AE/L43A